MTDEEFSERFKKLFNGVVDLLRESEKFMDDCSKVATLEKQKVVEKFYEAGFWLRAFVDGEAQVRSMTIIAIPKKVRLEENGTKEKTQTH